MRGGRHRRLLKSSSGAPSGLPIQSGRPPISHTAPTFGGTLTDNDSHRRQPPEQVAAGKRHADEPLERGGIVSAGAPASGEFWLPMGKCMCYPRRSV
jgi:hypothetical protein